MTTDEREESGFEAGAAYLVERLSQDGWRVSRSRRGVKARRGMLRICLRYKGSHGETPWRARLSESFPRMTVFERYAESPQLSLEPVLARTADVCALINGSAGLVQNESKSWVGYRLWHAVRPQ